jgi:hypothetical protein
VKPGSRRYVQDAFHSPLPQQVDEEISLAFRSFFPIYEGVPLLDEAGDVLLCVVSGFPDLDGVVSEFLSRSRGNDETSSRRDGGPWRGRRGTHQASGLGEPRVVSGA